MNTWESLIKFLNQKKKHTNFMVDQHNKFLHTVRPNQNQTSWESLKKHCSLLFFSGHGYPKSSSFLNRFCFLYRLHSLGQVTVSILKKNSRHLGVSKNSGTPKSSILIGFSIIYIHHPFRLFSPYFWKHPFHQILKVSQIWICIYSIIKRCLVPL